MNHEHPDPHPHHSHQAENFGLRFWVSLAATIPIFVLSPHFWQMLGVGEGIHFNGDRYVLWGFATFVFAWGGWPFLKGFWDEMKELNPGMMTLIAVAISIAYFYSTASVLDFQGLQFLQSTSSSGKDFFLELATLVDIMLLGHWIEMKSVHSASGALESLAHLLPAFAHQLLPNGSVVDVPRRQLRSQDQILVKSSEKIPTDGVVIDGVSSVDEALLTGESTPVVKKKGQHVIGGSTNLEGSFVMRVTQTGQDSYLNQVIELVRSAQESSSRTQDLADRVARWLTLIALSASALTFAAWYFWIGEGLSENLASAIERAVTVAVTTCPHALGLAIPLVISVSTALAAQRGFIIRDRTAFEHAHALQSVLFDKTGTLTEGKFSVTDTIELNKTPRLPGFIEEDEWLRLAASVEAHSEHPIAQAIAAKISHRLPVQEFKAIPGVGARGIVQGKEVEIVNPAYLKEIGARDLEMEELNRLSYQGKTVVCVRINGSVVGLIALADQIRPEAKVAIRRLKERGIRCLMVTGDNYPASQRVARALGIEEFFAEVTPQRKAQIVQREQSQGLLVAMVGDGVNDAPALAQADLALAIGAGTDIAIRTADVILVRSNPLDVITVIELSKRTYRKMIENLAWATGYNVIAIPLAAGVLSEIGISLSPAAGAVLMSASTVIVAINAKNLKMFEDSEVFGLSQR